MLNSLVLTMNEMKDIENFDQHVLASSTTALVKLLGLQNTDDINVLIQNSWHKIKDIHRSMVFVSWIRICQAITVVK